MGESCITAKARLQAKGEASTQFAQGSGKTMPAIACSHDSIAPIVRDAMATAKADTTYGATIAHWE